MLLTTVPQCLPHPLYAVLWALSHVMLPDPHDNPTMPTQYAGDSPVSPNVRCKFLTPKLRVLAGTGAVLGTPVPKTSVHEYRHST
jgi:hypothetical protein